MVRKPEIYLASILESADLIEKRIRNVNFEEFNRNIDLQDMVLRRLEVIGEAVRSLPLEFRRKYPHIDWQKPADMRSVLIHAYLDVDLDIVWVTVNRDLPLFKEQIQKIL